MKCAGFLRKLDYPSRDGCRSYARSRSTLTSSRPLTVRQREEGLAFLSVIVVWLPLYLLWFRIAINSVLFRYVDSYPAMLHVFPIFAVPYAVSVVYGRLREGIGTLPSPG
jgi:hypothetical protein